MIAAEDIQFIENNRRHYDTWLSAQYVKHLDGATRNGMLAIIRRYFAGNYIADVWCQSCVANMLVYLYTQYDRYTAGSVGAKPLYIKNDMELIGDFIGAIPAICTLAETTPVVMQVKENMLQLAKLIPLNNNLQIVTSDVGNVDITLDLQKSFTYAQSRNLHMVQAHYNTLGLPVPTAVPRPKLNFVPQTVPVFDYVIAPFSRSLPVQQKWQQQKWQALVNSLPNYTFCLFGSSKFDDGSFITGANVTPVFDEGFNTVCNIMQQCRHGLISVVTGISHLAHALNTKNYLFFNQGAWGKNPDAILMDKNIYDITVDEVLNVLKTK